MRGGSQNDETNKHVSNEKTRQNSGGKEKLNEKETSNLTDAEFKKP